MTTKLVQKDLLKGTREFEIVDDAINVRIKTPFKEKRSTVVLEILNPDPVLNGSNLEFHSRVKCGPLLTLMVNKPNKAEYEAFVEEVSRRAKSAFDAFAGIKPLT